jgi:hypothetical protein
MNIIFRPLSSHTWFSLGEGGGEYLKAFCENLSAPDSICIFLREREREKGVFAGASSIIHSRIIWCGDGGGVARAISPRTTCRFLNLGRVIV